MVSQQASGEVEIDGGYFGGYVKPANYKENRRDRRLVANQTGKRRVVVVMRERNGKALPFVSPSEDAAVPTIRARVANGSTIYAVNAGAKLHRLAGAKIHQRCWQEGPRTGGRWFRHQAWVGLSAGVSELAGRGARLL
jgi:hypothetical protein